MAGEAPIGLTKTRSQFMGALRRTITEAGLGEQTVEMLRAEMDCVDPDTGALTSAFR